MENLDDESSTEISNSYRFSNGPYMNHSALFETRLFYVRIAPCVINSVPSHLMLHHLRREIGTSLEINNSRVPASESTSLTLRRDRLDKESSEVTYVSTDTVRVAGGVEFEVYENQDLILCGSLERMESDWGNGCAGLDNNARTGWSMDCYMSASIGSGSSAFFQPKLGVSSPSFEVYIAGCCSGVPVILTKTIQISPRRKAVRHPFLDAIPEDEEMGKEQRNSDGLVRHRKGQGKGKVSRTSITFPPAARRMDTLNDLLAASDLISLHCALSNETVHIINAECLQNIKPGAFIVNTGSTQLMDDCAVKQLLIDGTLAGCALDGAEGPQWMEAWLKEMPNVLILPRSADYSEEVWMEIREKAISMLHTFFFDGIVPKNAISDEEEEESEIADENEQSDKQDRESALQGSVGERLTENALVSPESSEKKDTIKSKESPGQHQVSSLSRSTTTRSEVRRSRSGKKAKKRHTHQKSQQKPDEPSALEKESISLREDDTAMSGTDQAVSSGSLFASPEESRSRKTPMESMQESTSDQRLKSKKKLGGKSDELLKDGYVVALYATDRPALHVSRQRVKGGGWFLDTMSNVTKRDPAAQFLIVFRSKDTIGLRSFAAGGKLLQINRRMEFVFASHSFDVWESWMLEGPLEECRLINCRNPSAVLEVRIEILAAVGEDDGITRWLD